MGAKRHSSKEYVEGKCISAFHLIFILYFNQMESEAWQRSREVFILLLIPSSTIWKSNSVVLGKHLPIVT